MKNKIFSTLSMLMASILFVLFSIALAASVNENGYLIAGFLVFVITILAINNHKTKAQGFTKRRIFSEFTILIGLFFAIAFASFEYTRLPPEENIKLANAECRRQAQEKDLYFFHIHFENFDKTKFTCHFNEEQIGIINKAKRN